nr:hypothetical protein [Novosphingobium panipatense]
MNNIVKLVQATGKALLLPADAITIVRTLKDDEREKYPHGKSGVWLNIGGLTQHAIVRETFGFILTKAGGASSERVLLAGTGGTKISMPRGVFSHAMEGEEKTKEGTEDATVVTTSLQGPQGPVAFFIKDSAEELLDMLSTDASDDDGRYDESGDGPEFSVSLEPRSTPVRRRRRKRPSAR